jgi:environmental stress-induced protein Ves
MKHYTQDMFKTLPWKNGGGITNEILKIPSKEEFNLRLSMAKIDIDGPFSLYPGYDRHLIILEGHGIDIPERLTIRDRAFSFSGESPITATLINGPVTDFNVMIRRNWGKAIVEKVSTGVRLQCDNDYLYVFCFERMELWELNYGEEYTTSADSITVGIELFNQ